MGVFKNNGTPQIIHFNRVFHYKPSILGYPYFWKHPYGVQRKKSPFEGKGFQVNQPLNNQGKGDTVDGSEIRRSRVDR